jgi:hypothetical protein
MAASKKGQDGSASASEALARRGKEASQLLASIKTQLGKLLTKHSRTNDWARVGVLGHAVDRLADLDSFLRKELS